MGLSIQFPQLGTHFTKIEVANTIKRLIIYINSSVSFMWISERSLILFIKTDQVDDAFTVTFSMTYKVCAFCLSVSAMGTNS